MMSKFWMVGLSLAGFFFAPRGALAFAALAAFSADGAEVCLIAEDGKSARIGRTPTAAREVPLPTESSGEILAVAASSANGWLLLTEDGIWRRRSGDGAFQAWLKPASSAEKWTDFAVDPVTENILLTVTVREEGESSSYSGFRWYVRKLDRVLPVFSRRVGAIDGLAFGPDGELFFGYQGDLWSGALESANEDGTLTRGLLIATRVAPLADLETDIGTPSGTGVRAVAVTATHVFVHQYRLGGSGWGWIARLPRPKAGSARPSAVEAGPASTWRQASKLLQSARVLGPQGSLAYLAAARDGRVMFRLGEGNHFFLQRRVNRPPEKWE